MFGGWVGVVYEEDVPVLFTNVIYKGYNQKTILITLPCHNRPSREQAESATYMHARVGSESYLSDFYILVLIFYSNNSVYEFRGYYIILCQQVCAYKYVCCPILGITPNLVPLCVCFVAKSFLFFLGLCLVFLLNN